jgi:hypothetical protein
MAHAHCMLNNKGYTQSRCVIRTASPRQQWLRERASLPVLYLNHVVALEDRTRWACYSKPTS